MIGVIILVIMTATETKRVWGQVMERAQHGPVVVEKDGRPAVAVISYEDFERYQELEDRIWGARAKAIREAGEYLDADKSAAALNAGLEE
jgi:antitoxin Phd